MMVFAATFKRTPENMQSFRLFITSLTTLIPCDECKVNFKAKLTRYPVEDYMSSNENLFFWVYLLRDLVNVHRMQKGDPMARPSPPFEQVKRKFWTALGIR